MAAAGLAGCATKPCRKGGKIRLAAVGVWGKGFSDWMPMVKSGKAELVALCDCDRSVLKKIADNKGFKSTGINLDKIPFYSDYRNLLKDAGALGIEAMTISTTDHTHAAIAIGAMKQGIHVYVQKPLVRTLGELDQFKKTAKEYGVVTQMGNQGSALEGLRRAVEVLQSGFLGDVKEVHVWTNRPVWPQGVEAAKLVGGSSDPIPETLDWNAWLGPAKDRPFKNKIPAGAKVHNPWRIAPTVYHPFNWRGFYDFGCGAFGDMACHTMNLPFRGLELGAVTSAERIFIEDSGWDITYPMKTTVKLTYAARKSKVRGVMLPEVALYWYDGDQRPSFKKEITDVLGKIPRTGCVIIGSKGILCSTNDYGGKSYVALKGETKTVDLEKHPVAKTVKRRIPFRRDAVDGQAKGPGAAAVSADGHYVEFLDAINCVGPVFEETGSRCYSDVDFSVPIMEGILVGCIAQRVPGKHVWDTEKQRFDNPVANALIAPYIRKGFEF
jgi:hypothetical protein